MRKAFSAEDVRRAESTLLAQQRSEDQLMQLAAHAVAGAARAMGPRRVLVLAGPGGNGGDGLFAAALLNMWGIDSDALVTADKHHESAAEALRLAGGTICTLADAEQLPHEESDYDLVIDAIAGLGSARPLTPGCADIVSRARNRSAQVLAVDIPTGVDATTGTAAEPCVHADVTVSFGLARAAHAFAPECGEVVLSDLRLPGASRSFAQVLEDQAQPVAHVAQEPTLASRFHWEDEPLVDNDTGLVTAPRPVGCTGPITDPRPSATSDKYSGGVVAVAAGSARYPGAGLLAVDGALNATPSMVRAIANDDAARLLVARHPEVVIHASVGDAGRAQAWVHGPGRGTDDAAADELRAVLDLKLPTVLDADSLTLLARHAELRDQVRAHPMVLLTPHAGEFARLYDAAVGADEPSAAASSAAAPRGRGAAMTRLAAELDCFVLHKGRITSVTAPGAPVYSVEAGHSFAATPGSGDVLSGVLGAVLAQAHLDESLASRAPLDTEAIIVEILHAVALHQHAAAIAARTPDGYAITTASAIARALPQAIARLLSAQR